MSPLELGFYGIGAVILLIAIRLPIGIVLALVSFLGIGQLRGLDVAFGLLRVVPFEFAAHWALSAIPMFLLMGAVAHHSGISSALFRAARLWLSGLPGGLAVASNFACAGFAAASGSSVATAAAMGRIAIPEMIRQGYDKALATGTVASAGTLGSLIPPSILFVLYGVFAETSITQLLIAGVFPGLLTAAVYALMIIGRCKLNPKLAPPTTIKVDRGERWRALGAVWPLLVLILGIIGGLYGGIVTPTEAGAFGAFLAFVIAFFQKRLSLKVIKDSVLEAVTSTARIFFVAVGAVMLTKFLALTGVPVYLGQLIGDWALDPLLLVIGASLIYLVLGMFLDPLGILLITLPVLLPMFEALDLDLIWFGVLVVKYLEIGLLTPPVGFNVYVIKSVVGDTVDLETIFRGVTWFLGCEVIIVALLIAYPQISLFLPNTMSN
ncbi:MAG: TRAP transporter large permease [Rhodospirillaceae bacterium]|nr:TRAP transporter large permease [Rhodospirillaceae bacterium]MBT7569429.1 TRAP transporter large permease [Rhodospirillaceae bacterium]